MHFCNNSQVSPRRACTQEPRQPPRPVATPPPSETTTARGRARSSWTLPVSPSLSQRTACPGRGTRWRRTFPAVAAAVGVAVAAVAAAAAAAAAGDVGAEAAAVPVEVEVTVAVAVAAAVAVAVAVEVATAAIETEEAAVAAAIAAVTAAAPVAAVGIAVAAAARSLLLAGAAATAAAETAYCHHCCVRLVLLQRGECSKSPRCPEREPWVIGAFYCYYDIVTANAASFCDGLIISIRKGIVY